MVKHLWETHYFFIFDSKNNNMEMDISTLGNVAEANFKKVISHFKEELLKIRAGKASATMLDGIMVDYYGTPTALSQVANINTPDSKTLSIQPWEKSMLAPIEQAIFGANLGLTPMNDGEFVRIIIPPLTEDRRKQLVKQAKSEGENAKVSIRNERQKWMNFIKKEVKDGYPEDAGKKKESELEGVVKSYIKNIDDLFSSKEKDILTV